MNEWIEENRKLTAFLAEMQEDLDRALRHLEEINAELADDPEDVASYQAMLRLSSVGVDKPIVAIEDGPTNEDLLIPREQVITRARTEWKNRFHKGKQIK